LWSVAAVRGATRTGDPFAVPASYSRKARAVRACKRCVACAAFTWSRVRACMRALRLVRACNAIRPRCVNVARACVRRAAGGRVLRGACVARRWDGAYGGRARGHPRVRCKAFLTPLSIPTNFYLCLPDRSM